MNLNTAIETMRFATELDARFSLQQTLKNVIDALVNLSSNPAEPSYQTNMRSVLDELAAKLSSVQDELSDANATRLRELGAEQLFPTDLYVQVAEHFNANVATPSVTQNKVQEIFNERANIFAGFVAVVDVAKTSGWEVHTEGEGEAEVGFTVPRFIFDNKLKGLTKELEWINRFVSAVTEASTGQSEEFEVSRISSTDPTVYIMTTATIAYTIGKVVDWALATWKSVEEIRHLRAQTSKLAAFTPEEVEAMFGDKIRQQVSEQVAAEVADLTANVKDTPRGNELDTHLTMLLGQFLQRIERGMTVEIRLLELQETEDQTETPEDKALRDNVETLASRLTFPPATKSPVLQLTGGASDDGKRTNARQAKG